MDEIDWIKIAKKALILFATILGGIAVLLGIILIGYGTDLEIVAYTILILVGAPLTLGLCLMIVQKVLNWGKTVKSKGKWYVRELPKHCSPATCSLIYDLKIDVYKDYTATILYLCLKKYIELIKDGDSYKLELGKERDYSDLGRCEKYVLDVIFKNEIFDEITFKRKIVEEAKRKQLIIDKKENNEIKVLLFFVIAIIILIIAFNINKIMACIVFGILCMVGVCLEVYIPVVYTEYKRTKDGKNIALLLNGLKRYIHEYTLIKDKEIDYIQILEEYIPYAISLDEAYAIEEFVKNNEEYRDLIYNIKIDKS